MKSLLLIILFPLISLAETAQVIQFTKVDNVSVNGVTVREAYLLAGDEMLIIGSYNTDDPADVEGLRLIQTKNNAITFSSPDVGESYFYHPTFFKFENNTILIVCEHGFEYYGGFDVYELSKGNIRKLGEVPIAAKGIDNPASIIPKLTVGYAETYNFFFEGKIIIEPGGHNEGEYNGNKFTGIYDEKLKKIVLSIAIE